MYVEGVASARSGGTGRAFWARSADGPVRVGSALDSGCRSGRTSGHRAPSRGPTSTWVPFGPATCARSVALLPTRISLAFRVVRRRMQAMPVPRNRRAAPRTGPPARARERAARRGVPAPSRRARRRGWGRASAPWCPDRSASRAERHSARLSIPKGTSRPASSRMLAAIRGGRKGIMVTTCGQTGPTVLQTVHRGRPRPLRRLIVVQLSRVMDSLGKTGRLRGAETKNLVWTSQKR